MELTREEVQNIAHRSCTRYWHSIEPISTPHMYTFNVHHLMDFIERIKEAQPTPEMYARGYAEGFNDACKGVTEQLNEVLNSPRSKTNTQHGN
jgi:hypothetical protein